MKISFSFCNYKDTFTELLTDISGTKLHKALQTIVHT